MAKVEIIGVAPSTYTRAARMACVEKGVDYELRLAAPHSPEVRAIHPFGRIPVMRHGDVELCESKAIATYLDRVFPGPALIPADPLEAALAEQWISLVNTVIDQILVRQYVFSYIFPKTADGKPDRAAIAAMAPKVTEQVALLDKGVAKTGYLAGKSYSFADINLMPILAYVGQFPEGKAAMAEARQLAAYFDRNASRRSFIETIPPPPSARDAQPN
jgi:glutathione S-transferase